MLCVSSISATLADVVWRDCSIAVLVLSCSSLRVRLTVAGGVLARLVDEAGDLLAVVHHRAREGEALSFDRLHGMIGGLDDLALNSLLLAPKAVEQRAGVGVEDLGHLGARGAELLADLVGAADEIARHLGADRRAGCVRRRWRSA
jgi:hypothetical protein